MKIAFEPDPEPGTSFEPDSHSGSIAFEPDPTQTEEDQFFNSSNTPGIDPEAESSRFLVDASGNPLIKSEAEKMADYIKAAPRAANRQMPVSSMDLGATDYVPQKFEGAGRSPDEMLARRDAGMILDIPKPEGKGLLQGIGRGGANALEGLVTVPNIALAMTGGELPSVINKIVAGGFSASLAHGAATDTAEVVKAFQAGDMDAVGERATGAVLNALFAAGTLNHAGPSPREFATPELRELRKAAVTAAPVADAGLPNTAAELVKTPGVADAVASLSVETQTALTERNQLAARLNEYPAGSYGRKVMEARIAELDASIRSSHTPQVFIDADPAGSIPVAAPVAPAEAAEAPAARKPFQTVLSPRSERLGDELVTLDTDALDKAWQKDAAGYIGPEDPGIEGRRDAARKFQAENDTGEAAEVSVDPQGKVTFTNGRHRVAEQREAGATQQSVAMTAESRLNAERSGLIPRGPVTETPFNPDIVALPEGATSGYKVQSGSATATVNEFPDVLKLKDIRSTAEGRGDASAVLDALKAKGKPIELFVGRGERGYSSPEKLRAWYGKRGFKALDEAGDRMRWEPEQAVTAAEPAPRAPKLQPGQRQGDLLAHAPEDLTLVGETQKPLRPEPARFGEEPTVEETVSAAVRAYGDIGTAHQRLQAQIEHADTSPKVKERLRAAQKRIAAIAEDQYRRDRDAEVSGLFDDKHELIQSVKDLGGLPALSTEKGKQAGGELGRVVEALGKGKALQLFRKGAKSLDDIRQMLNDRGFNFETPYDMLEAIEDSISTGRKYHGTSEVAQGELPFGPGKMTVGELPPQRTTGLKRDVVDTERLSRGAEEIPTVERQREEEVVRSAEDLMDSDPTAAPKLIARILDEKNPAVTEQDAALLLAERNRVMNERDRWQDVLGDEESTPAERDAAREGLAGYEAQMDRLDRAQRAVGSTWGRIGHMYQRLIQEDFTLAAMERKERAAKGRPLTSDETAEIRKLHADIAELQKQVERGQHAEQEASDLAEVARTYAETVKELQGELAGRPAYGKEVFEIAHKIVDRWKKEADEARTEWLKSFGHANAIPIPTQAIVYLAKMIRAKIGEFGLSKAETLSSLVAELGDDVRPIFEKAWAKAHVLIDGEKTTKEVKQRVKGGVKKKDVPTSTVVKAKAKAEALAEEPLSHETVYQLVKSKINEGVHGEDAVMKAVFDELKDVYPDITERDVRRAYVEYGKARFPSQDAVKKEMRELRTLVRLQESIDRETEGLPALRNGQQRDAATQAIRDKTKALNELLKQRAGSPSPEQLKSRDQARQTAIKNRIADIDRELKTGEHAPKPAPFPPSPATETLMAERDAMQAKLNEVRAAENPGPTPAEKQLEDLGKIKQRLDDVLSGKVDPTPRAETKLLSSAAESMQAEIDAMRELAAQLKRDAKPKEDPNAKAERLQIKALEDSIKLYEDKLTAKDFETQPGTATRPDTEAVSKLRDIRDARRVAYEAARKASKPVRTPEERYNETRLKQVQKQIDSLNDRMARKDFAPAPKRVTPTKGKAVQDLEVELAKKKTEFRNRLMEAERAQRTGFQKLSDFVSSLSRASVLGHVSVLEHLTGAALENIVTRPASSAVAQLLRFNETMNAIRKKATYEGGWGGEMVSAKATLSSMKAVLDKLRHGKSDIDWLHDNGRVYPPEVMEWVGNTHGAIKEPVRQGIYARAVRLGIQAAEERGLDPKTDPVLMKAITADAYHVANADIFIGDNFLTKAIHSNVNAYLRGQKMDTGLARFTANVLDILFPVVNVPINIAIRKARLAVGLGEFFARVGKAAKAGELANGAEKLTPRDAELIAKSFKYGVTGVALAAYAWTHANQFGGVYTAGQNAPRDSKTHLKPGEIALPRGLYFDHISHHMAHGPWGGHLNMVADARRVYDRMKKEHPNSPWNNLGEAAFFSMWAGLKDIPAVGTVSRLASPFKSAAVKAGELVKNIAVFGGLQDLAEQMDGKEREPKTFADEIKSAIPFLRETVPEKKRK